MAGEDAGARAADEGAPEEAARGLLDSDRCDRGGGQSVPDLPRSHAGGGDDGATGLRPLLPCRVHQGCCARTPPYAAAAPPTRASVLPSATAHTFASRCLTLASPSALPHVSPPVLSSLLGTEPLLYYPARPPPDRTIALFDLLIWVVLVFVFSPLVLSCPFLDLRRRNFGQSHGFGNSL